MSKNQIELIQGEKGMELPLEAGNWVLLKDYGYSPVQSLVAAVGACGAYVYQSILTNSKIPFTFEKVLIEYTRDAERQSEPVKKIEMVFDVKVAPELQDRATRGIKLIAKNCPVMQSLDPAIEVIETVNFI
ncbi:OsmC family protein [Vagococcus sp. BWB3-3]|uniref:OsmC family protein n=1 Tax=Vagococcus allomyrinae TaxID=2794353 RepID=A0A940P1J9_9ENTE|nr:OsmC family protein [Vagococcus allomyrinae]MBP1039772.1 OsmC family protein [Vagococcus allomyrinae]